MIIGWREYLKIRFRKPSRYHSMGIEFGANDLHISCLKKVKGQLQWVLQESIPIQNWQLGLKNYVQQHNLLNTKCNLALAISKYQVLQVDKPAVQDEELVGALQWSVKEQLGADEEWVIDYFDAPVSSGAGAKVNVVAQNKRDIAEIRTGVLNAGLALHSIGLEELSFCNLFPIAEDAVMVLKQEAGGQLSLSIVKQGQLYFSRRLRGYENIGSLSPQELSMGVVDNLSLEIQRSMDYFESQLRQAPIKNIYLAMDTLHQEELASMIKDIIFTPVSEFLPDIERDNSLPITPACLASLGAAVFKPGLVNE